MIPKRHCWRMDCRLAYIALLVMIVVIAPTEASAVAPEADLNTLSFEQHDLDGDATPDMATITADYMGERYRVAVYDQGLDMQWSDDWRTGTDFVNDIWLFQPEASEQIKLIIVFSQTPEGYLAELYDDFDGDGDVAYRIHSLTSVEILESSFPVMRMTAQQPWLLPDGQVNYMVHCTTYRPWLVPFIEPPIVPYLPPNGIPSYSHEVVDSDANGIPDYELRLAFPDVPSDWIVFRSAINTNISRTSLPGFQGAFFWPYLGYAHPDDQSPAHLGRGPEDLAPPVQINWRDGRMMAIAAFFPNFGIGDQWQILTTKPIEKNTVNELDWEVFAFYDFTGDTVMDVLFRLIHQPVDPVRIGSNTLHLEQVSYAWHHQNRDTMKWDYELELAALHELPSTVVEFQDFSVYTVPYEDLLWHYSRPSDWAYATFVAVESGASESSEGIWEWGTLEGIQTDVTLPQEERYVPGGMEAQHEYLRGWADVSPADLYTEIREGLRGEYADLMGPASLYFSSIDRRLHLSEAQKGLWNLGNSREIQYENLGGVYLDSWILLENNEPLKYLYAPPGYLIYQDRGGVQLFQVDVPPALFTTVPPRDRAEWEELDAKLVEYRVDSAPDDLLAMAEQFGEPRLVISKASIKDLRLSEGGFRFILDLQPGFSVSGDGGPAIEGLSPGSYVATYHNAFRIQPLVPPNLSIEFSPPAAFPLEVPTALVGHELTLDLTNEGLEDAHAVTVTVRASSPSGQAIELEPRVTEVLAGTARRLLFPWVPSEPGLWTFQAEVSGTWLETASISHRPHEVEVAPAEQPDLWSTIAAFGLVPPWAIVGFLLATVLFGVAFLVALVRLRPARPYGSRRRAP